MIVAVGRGRRIGNAHSPLSSEHHQGRSSCVGTQCRPMNGWRWLGLQTCPAPGSSLGRSREPDQWASPAGSFPQLVAVISKWWDGHKLNVCHCQHNNTQCCSKISSNFLTDGQIKLYYVWGKKVYCELLQILMMICVLICRNISSKGISFVSKQHKVYFITHLSWIKHTLKYNLCITYYRYRGKNNLYSFVPANLAKWRQAVVFGWICTFINTPIIRPDDRNQLLPWKSQAEW